MIGNYALLKSLSWICCRLSEPAAIRMGNWLGKFFWACVPGKRKQLAVNNIIRAGITDDPKEARRIAKISSVRFGHIGVTMFRFPLLNKGNISQFVTIEGAEKLDRIKAEGKGCVLAATHCGNWEIEGAALALYGYPLLSVAMQQKNKEFDKFLTEYRSMPGQTVEYKTGVRDMLRRLKQGYFVGLLCDQDPGHTGIPSQFFGQKTLTPAGPAHFSLLCKLPVMTALIHETSPGRFVITIGDPITAEPGLNKKEAVADITQKINNRLEAWIRKYPEEWFWLHNRWKWTDRLHPEWREEK
jgi:KDO2-lipid IV(A) lauroyltransferase